MLWSYSRSQKIQELIRANKNLKVELEETNSQLKAMQEAVTKQMKQIQDDTKTRVKHECSQLRGNMNHQLKATQEEIMKQMENKYDSLRKEIENAKNGENQIKTHTEADSSEQILHAAEQQNQEGVQSNHDDDNVELHPVN